MRFRCFHECAPLLDGNGELRPVLHLHARHQLIFAILGFENRRFVFLHIELRLERAHVILGFNDEMVLATSREDHQRSGPAVLIQERPTGGLVSA